jgi:sec-independent protein translocase protein TatB
MFGMGMGELIVILIVALLVLGPDKIPEAARTIGKGIRELRKHTTNLQQTIEDDETLGGTVKELRSVLRGDDPMPPPPASGLRAPAPPPVGAVPPAPAPEDIATAPLAPAATSHAMFDKDRGTGDG